VEVSLALAFGAGLLSFVSPCVLALVPVYLAFLGETAGGVAASEAASDGTAAARPRSPVLLEALLFVAGFSLLFILLGVSVGLAGKALFRVPEVRQAAGIGIIAIGVLSTGVFGPILDRWRIGVPSDLLPTTRGMRALALGALVAIGWSPCIGPVLGAILTMGASTQEAGVAALLLLAYSAGLAVPFLAAAVALPRLKPVLDLLRRHHRSVAAISGIFIILIGILVLTNAFARLAGMFTFFI
jgi:cytochrome c-type biogenesis protein